MINQLKNTKYSPVFRGKALFLLLDYSNDIIFRESTINSILEK